MQEKLENNFSEVWRLYGKRKMLAPVLQIIEKRACTKLVTVMVQVCSLFIFQAFCLSFFVCFFSGHRHDWVSFIMLLNYMDTLRLDQGYFAQNTLLVFMNPFFTLSQNGKSFMFGYFFMFNVNNSFL